MGTYIICGILVIVVVAALLGSKKHFKGEGGCCGGGGDVKIKPKHLDTIVATKKLQIEGMSAPSFTIASPFLKLALALTWAMPLRAFSMRFWQFAQDIPSI